MVHEGSTAPYSGGLFSVAAQSPTALSFPEGRKLMFFNNRTKVIIMWSSHPL